MTGDDRVVPIRDKEERGIGRRGKRGRMANCPLLWA